MILFPDRKAKSLGLNSKMYRSSSNNPETNEKMMKSSGLK
jgi:hypothetical protein